MHLRKYLLKGEKTPDFLETPLKFAIRRNFQFSKWEEVLEMVVRSAPHPASHDSGQLFSLWTNKVFKWVFLPRSPTNEEWKNMLKRKREQWMRDKGLGIWVVGMGHSVCVCVYVRVHMHACMYTRAHAHAQRQTHYRSCICMMAKGTLDAY